MVLHPVWGMLLLLATLFLMFQGGIHLGFRAYRLDQRRRWNGLPPSSSSTWPMARCAACWWMASWPARAGVLVFLPQILTLFLFILALEDSGYLPRAAFLLDRVMGTVGLSGRSFIPLLSSFACAVPGVMATRSITHWRDRLVTIMIAPLMTCSARLPVYALLIGAFIPERTVAGLFNLQGLVLFALYVGGIASAMAVAGVAKLARSDQRPRSC